MSHSSALSRLVRSGSRSGSGSRALCSRRTSREYLTCFLHYSILSRNRVSCKPGAIQISDAVCNVGGMAAILSRACQTNNQPGLLFDPRKSTAPKSEESAPPQSRHVLKIRQKLEIVIGSG